MSSRTFDEAAHLYDEVRPGYPEQLYEDILSFSTGPKAEILEIGCGTGQATLPLARRGYRILCLDPGENLVSIAMKRCQSFPDVRFQTTTFEDWQPQNQSFDLIVSATAFHWVDPEIGYKKAAEVLRPQGYVALFWNLHPEPYTGFFSCVQEVYHRVVPQWGVTDQRPSTKERLEAIKTQIRRSGYFQEPILKQYTWSTRFTTEQYIRLLNTYSDHRSLEESIRKELLRQIAELIEREYSGYVSRPYLTALFLAKKK